MKKTGSLSICLLAACAVSLLAACSADDTPQRAAFALAQDAKYDEEGGTPIVDGAWVDGLPLCTDVEIPAGEVTVYIVDGSGGLYAVAVNGEPICVDDQAGLLESGVPANKIPEEQDPPSTDTSQPTDGTPLPAHLGDGTPLPA